MSNTKYNRGSEWRKWDLHIHTPFTKLNNNFIVEKGDVWDEYCKKIHDSDVEVFAITDYFSADNYFIFLEKYKVLYPESAKLFFCNIEFRLEVSVNRSAEEVNIHVVFSNTVIKKKIDEFLGKLNTNITNKGAVVSCQGISEESDFKKAGIDYTKLREKLKEVFGKENCYVLLAAANNAGLRPDTKSPRKLNVTDEIDKTCDGFFGGKQNIEYYLKTDRYESKELAKAKPVITGCDAHSFIDIDDFLGKCVKRNDTKGDIEIVKDTTWVKAETTFEGLLQILNEPSRIFIGEIPPILKAVAVNPTKYIKSIEIRKVPGSTIADTWFDNFEIDMNPELVAIIGNKGKGKSALSDILGLCGNAHIDQTHFSFLNKEKFRNPRPNLAKEFEAVIHWEGGSPESINLSATSNLDSPERVKYLPQNFLERLCTSVDKKIFEEELEKVIFSRLEDYQKLGKGTLTEVLNNRKQSLQNEINQIKTAILQQNIRITELEKKNSVSYRNSINESLLAKENELRVHIEKEPLKKEPPAETDEKRQKTEDVGRKIAEQRGIIKIQQHLIDSLSRERATLEIDINEATTLRDRLNGLADYINKFLETNKIFIEKFGLSEDSLVTYTVNIESVAAIILQKSIRIDEIEGLLIDTNPSNPELLINNANAAIKTLQEELEGESKQYQQYLTEVLDWERQKNQITGTTEKDETLNYYQVIKNYLDNNIETDLTEAYIKRINTLKELLALKQSIADLYRELYKPVTEFIAMNKNELSDYNVNVDVALEIHEFESKLFNYISNGAAGSFYGVNEARLMLNKISEVVDFNDTNAVVEWVNKILDHLHYDKRQEDGNQDKKELKSQLKGGFSDKDFYDFLFSMDYYEPRYQLKLGNKDLTELSPGERGALLLIFYLLLDKRDIPIIIDQPEENLDNQSVYKILVHFIKKAKQRRQIIIVTHNPNLAVVCDAEQIIRMDIAKEKKNKVSFITGGIENTDINKAIVDILEGTRPAFNNRTYKYEVSNV